MQEGQLDRVLDRLDLRGEAADRGVGDVGHLFEDQLFDLGLRHPLVSPTAAGVDEQRIAGAQRRVLQRRREVDDALLIGMSDDQGAILTVENLLEQDDLALPLELESADDVHRLVEHDLLATLQLLDLDVRRNHDAQLAALREDVDRAVFLGLEKDAEAGRRLRQPVDLGLQGEHLIARLAQGGHQLLVLADEPADPRLRLAQPLLEHPGGTRGLHQPAAQSGDLLLEERDLAQQLGDFLFRSCALALRVRRAFRATPART